MSKLRAVGTLIVAAGAGMILLFAVIYWRVHGWASQAARFELHEREHGGGEVIDTGGMVHQVTDAKLWFLLALGVAVLVLGLLVLSMARKRRSRPNRPAP
jgi:surface polysaccharide O-acyltransferase-like enzyme